MLVTHSQMCAGINGNLTYLIPSGMAGDKFAVDPRGGHITTTVSLDREERSYYVITGNNC